MAIRRSILILVWLAGALRAAQPSVKTLPLDERAIYTLAIHRDAPTTCMFPGPLSAVEAANLSTRLEDQPPVLLSYQAGSAFFSVRALRDDARAAVNLIYRGRILVINFEASANPDRSVRFFDEPPRALAAVQAAKLLHRAKQIARAEQPTAVAVQVERAAPNTRTDYRDFSVTVEELIRFDAEDAVVCRLRLDNASGSLLRYDADHLVVRVGGMVYPAVAVDATGEVAARGFAFAWLIVAGRPDVMPGNLSLRETFAAIVPRAP
jgi:hypothetical protein